MADYPARPAELEQLFAARVAAQSDPATKDPTPQPVLDAIHNGLAQYYTYRDGALASALKDHLPAGEGAKAKDRDDDWCNYLQGVRDAATKTFADDLSHDAKGEVESLLGIIAIQERDFFDKLSGLPLARALGEVREMMASLTATAQSLEDKWNATIAQNERQDGQIANLRNQVLTLLQQSVTGVLSWERDLEAAVRKGLDALSALKKAGALKLLGMPRDLGPPIEQAQKMLKLLPNRPTLDQMSQAAADLLSGKRVFS